MRRSMVDLRVAAEDDLADAFRHLGLDAKVADADAGADLIVHLDGQDVAISVKALATLTPERASTLPRRSASGPVAVAVADSVAVAAAEPLGERGWGWLDRRRGRLVLRGRGFFVDTSVPTVARSVVAGREAITGRAGLAFAAALLMHPADPPSIRSVAALAGMGSSTVGEAAVRLRRASLVKNDGSPLVPELFWELAEAWPAAEAVALRRLPEEAILNPGLERGGGGALMGVGPVLSGTVAALAYSAPVVVAGDVPPDFLLPDAAAVARLRRLCGVADSFDDRACTVAVAPTRMACVARVSMSTSPPWPVAHPLFVALDLAQDHGRGREILDGFTPPDGFVRVW